MDTITCTDCGGIIRVDDETHEIDEAGTHCEACYMDFIESMRSESRSHYVPITTFADYLRAKGEKVTQ